jgi:hypothetical protein
MQLHGACCLKATTGLPGARPQHPWRAGRKRIRHGFSAGIPGFLIHVRLDKLDFKGRCATAAGLQGALKRAMGVHFFCCGIFTTRNLRVVIAASLELVNLGGAAYWPNQSLLAQPVES